MAGKRSDLNLSGRRLYLCKMVVLRRIFEDHLVNSKFCGFLTLCSIKPCIFAQKPFLYIFFHQGYKTSEERKSEQQNVDTAILAEIQKEPQMKKYMTQLFTLRKGQFPHEMKF